MLNVIDQRLEVLFGREEVQHDILLNYLQEIDDHVILFEIAIASIFLEEEFEVPYARVIQANSTCSKEPEVNDHRVWLLCQFIIEDRNTHF